MTFTEARFLSETTLEKATQVEARGVFISLFLNTSARVSFLLIYIYVNAVTFKHTV